MILDIKKFNADNVRPTAARPLLLRIREKAPSLKNDRDLIVTDRGTTSVPNKTVAKFVRSARAAIDRQLPDGWTPIPMPLEVKLLMIVGAHAVSTIPDADADNMGTTIQEALAYPDNVSKIPEGQEAARFVVVNDRQVQCPIPFRIPFRVKENIYNDILVWISDSNILTFVDELILVNKTIEELYGQSE